MTAPSHPAIPAELDHLVTALGDRDRVAATAAARPGRGVRPSAVLALIGPGPDLVFIERAATLRHHAGQIAFPGGGVEPGDMDLVHTALREAQEEVGLDPSGVRVLGTLPAVHVAVSGFDVTVVVGWWEHPSTVGVQDVAEVAAVHAISIADLVDPGHRVSVRHPSGYTGPGFLVGDLLIWGLTAHLVDAILELAGWSEPWDAAVTSEIPARFLRDRSRRETGTAADTH